MACAGQGSPNQAKVAAIAFAVFPPVRIATPLGPRRLAAVMTAIAGQESAYEPSATSGPYVGLWQIDRYHVRLQRYFGQSSPAAFAAWLQDPYHNAIAARRLMEERGGSWENRLAAWSTWTSGVYAECLPSVDPIMVRLVQRAQPHEATRRAQRRAAAITAAAGAAVLATAGVLAVTL